jgi:predicted nicotinamide N-methyase
MTSPHGHDRLPGPAGALAAEETGPLLLRAEACATRGEIGQAEKLIRQVLARDPRHPGALFELGRIANLKGDKRAAADCLQKAIASQPDNGKFHSELGVVWIGLGDRQQALRAFERALAIDPADADAISNMGTFHLGEGRLAEALAAYRRALAIDPQHLNARLNLGLALKNAVPPWHFPMMNDGPRNAAYDEAIRRVAPGRSVLDIGTGAGLLAMMAARAGARSVASCEAVPWIAAKAREVVAANGLADRIKLIAKRSTELQIGTDLPERAEVLVTEVFSTSGINEHVIPTVTHGMRSSCSRGRRWCPMRRARGPIWPAARRWKAISTSSARPASPSRHSTTSRRPIWVWTCIMFRTTFSPTISRSSGSISCDRRCNRRNG